MLLLFSEAIFSESGRILTMKIFFSGIAGSGMSAIAQFMSDKGYRVSGSDRLFDLNFEHPMLKLFKSKKIKIVPQDGRGIDSTFDLIIFSTAVEQHNIEYTKARSLGLTIMTRPQYLANIIKDYKTIAISGTSGKSTTAGLIAFLMHRLRMNPNFIGGGRVKSFKNDLNLGNTLTGNSDFMVMEACESDGTIINYYPQNSIVLNLQLDHHSIDKTSQMFKILNEHTSKLTVINADDSNLKKINFKNAITFSIDNNADYKAENIHYDYFCSKFSVNGINFKLSIPGRHNIYNALSAIAILSQMGIPLTEIASLLPEFTGIERRFDIHLNNDEYFVVDDYAHNPHKISALMQTVRLMKENICYIFQPHGYTPLRMMWDEYVSAFSANLRDSDNLILLPVFYAGGTVKKDVSSLDLAYAIRSGGKSVQAVDDKEAVFELIGNWKNFIIFGARDDSLSVFAMRIANKLTRLQHKIK